jgi:hypothetical protein
MKKVADWSAYLFLRWCPYPDSGLNKFLVNFLLKTNYWLKYVLKAYLWIKKLNDMDFSSSSGIDSPTHTYLIKGSVFSIDPVTDA